MANLAPSLWFSLPGPLAERAWPPVFLIFLGDHGYYQMQYSGRPITSPVAAVGYRPSEPLDKTGK
jgi:hypothetical protein